jgi:hypothetical protein
MVPLHLILRLLHSSLRVQASISQGLLVNYSGVNPTKLLRRELDVSQWYVLRHAYYCLPFGSRSYRRLSNNTAYSIYA